MIKTCSIKGLLILNSIRNKCSELHVFMFSADVYGAAAQAATGGAAESTGRQDAASMDFIKYQIAI
jgi:hypothetical protein